MTKNPIVLFFSLAMILALIFFLLPINLFDGEIVYKEAHREYTVQAPLSLSYFIGIGYEEADMVTVKTFYLTAKGILMAFIFILGLPAILAYRMYLKSTSKK